MTIGKSVVSKLLAIVGLGACLLVTKDVSAGSQVGATPYCYNGPSYGFCEGTFYAFRTDNYANDYAEFYNSGTSSYSFSAEYQNAIYGCFLASGSQSSAYAPLFQTALTFRGYFYVQWTSSGMCSDIQLINDSQYVSTW
jgi:hypothetical protein